MSKRRRPYIDALLEARPQKEEQKVRPVIKDVRIFFNSISHAIGLVRQAGIQATYTQEEASDHYKMMIFIPKGGA